MKQSILLFLFVFTALSSIQSQTVEGAYELKFGDVLTDTLIIKSDNTFTYHRYQKSEKPNPNINLYAKGTWKLDKKILLLYADSKNDMDKVHTLNLNNSKARFISKSPRDTSDKVVRTALIFYESELFWIKGTELFKID